MYTQALCYHAVHRCCILHHCIPETGVSWEMSIFVFLTCSCTWPGTGSSFSLDTASALCSALLWGASISRPKACPWELVRTRLLLQRLPKGGVRSWKEEGRSWEACWRWCWWMGSCQLCCWGTEGDMLGWSSYKHVKQVFRWLAIRITSSCWSNRSSV